MWLLTVDTRHFTFEGVGRTQEEAQTRLRRVLRIHALQYGIADTERWIRETADEAETRLLLPGGYRDRERLER